MKKKTYQNHVLISRNFDKSQERTNDKRIFLFEFLTLFFLFRAF